MSWCCIPPTTVRIIHTLLILSLHNYGILDSLLCLQSSGLPSSDSLKMAQEALPKQSLYSALLWPSIFLIIGSFFYWILNPTFEMLAIRQADLHPYHQVTFTPNQQDANRDKSKIYLSIVIPAYNEQERLPNMLHKTLKFLGTKNYTYEVPLLCNVFSFYQFCHFCGSPIFLLGNSFWCTDYSCGW